jgi:hypothetical protein
MSSVNISVDSWTDALQNLGRYQEGRVYALSEESWRVAQV